ncbi:MAG: radical SAM protein [Caldilineaceae bacterium]|nr:radical SAM protein [Caldilineaceae bacterium]
MEGAIDLRTRLKYLLMILSALWPPNRHDLWRLGNAFRCILSQSKEKVSSKPFYAQIEPTTACNLSCRFCLNPTLTVRHTLSYDDFLQALNGLPTLLMLNLQGLGEPTLNKDLFRMASEARRRKIYTFTVTNLNLPELIIDKLAQSDFSAINISMESIDPDQYSWYRVGGDLALLEQNLQMLKEKRESYGTDFVVGIWTLITEDTIDKVHEIFQFAKGSGIIERIQFVFLTDKKSHLDNYDGDLRKQLVVNRRATASDIRKRLRSLSKEFGILGYLVEGRCRWLWTGIFVNAEGYVAPCCNIKNYREPAWGNIRLEENLAEVWQGNEWNMVRKGILSESDGHPSCTGCPYLY